MCFPNVVLLWHQSHIKIAKKFIQLYFVIVPQNHSWKKAVYEILINQIWKHFKKMYILGPESWWTLKNQHRPPYQQRREAKHIIVSMDVKFSSAKFSIIHNTFQYTQTGKTCPLWQGTSMKGSFLVTDIGNIYEGTVLSAIGNMSEKSTLSIKAMIKAWIYFLSQNKERFTLFFFNNVL